MSNERTTFWEKVILPIVLASLVAIPGIISAFKANSAANAARAAVQKADIMLKEQAELSQEVKTQL